MPATRAVLRDIADNGLDPRIAHTRCAHDGRLVGARDVDPIQNVTIKTQEDVILKEVDVVLEGSQEPKSVDVPLAVKEMPNAKEPEKVVMSSVDPKKASKQKPAKLQPV